MGLGERVASVLVSVGTCVALDYSLGSNMPQVDYGEDTLQKESEEDTMEYMDNLKEVVDASITPLSEMDSLADLSDEPTAADSAQTTELDPHDHIRQKKLSTPATQETDTTTADERPKRPKARVGRPRKTTLFPMIKGITILPKKRMKWDDKMNKFIMFTYYYVTKMETDKLQYRRKLREKFLEAYPEWEGITEQRLADQKRSIRQNRLVGIETTREIKRAVRQELEKQGVVVPNVADSRDKSFYD